MNRLLHKLSGQNCSIDLETVENQLKEHARLNEFILKNLKAWDHYVPVDDGAGNVRRFLTKNGAMTLCQAFNLSPVYYMERETIQAGGALTDMVVVMRCELKEQSGEVVGAGYAGAAASTFNSINMAVKMAKKSALVDAVIDALGLDFSPDSDYEKFKDNLQSAQSVLPAEERGALISNIRQMLEHLGISEQQVLARYGIDSFEKGDDALLKEIAEFCSKRIPAKTEQSDQAHQARQ